MTGRPTDPVLGFGSSDPNPNNPGGSQTLPYAVGPRSRERRRQDAGVAGRGPLSEEPGRIALFSA